MPRRPIFAFATLMLLGGCTIHHSRQALDPTSPAPSPEATFVSEEDSGLGILGMLGTSLVLISEPDHYVVIMERLRRHYRCGRIHHAQLDFYTDNWVLVTFPVARVTAICEPPGSPEGDATDVDATDGDATQGSSAAGADTASSGNTAAAGEGAVQVRNAKPTAAAGTATTPATDAEAAPVARDAATDQPAPKTPTPPAPSGR